MPTSKKKAKARPSVKFKDLKTKKNPKGGSISWGASNPTSTGVGGVGLESKEKM
jgi:hypothetical protein